MASADFAHAQQRLAARRRQWEVKQRALAAQQQRATVASRSDRLPGTVNNLLGSLQQQWQAVAEREGTRPAFRVGQVDAELLDEELLELLKGQVGEALKYYGSHIRDDWAAEILLFLRAILFKLSIWDHDASYGAALQNLRYTDARHSGPTPVAPSTIQKVLYGLVSVGGRYGWTKWEDWLLSVEGGYDEPSRNVQVLSRASSILSTVHSVASFASFTVFLLNGRYRTILDRILRLRLTPTTNRIGREVSFEYLNRQLVWHAFTEFLLFLLPLVGISRWRRWLSRLWRKTRTLFSTSDADEEDLKIGGELGFLPERTCAICYQDQNPSSTTENEIVAISGNSSGVIGSAQTDITNAYEAIPCGCKYCFACLAQRLEAEEGEGWVCLRCGEIVREAKAWNGDVLEPRSKATVQKSVGFVEDSQAEEAQSERAFQTLDPAPAEDELETVGGTEVDEVGPGPEDTAEEEDDDDQGEGGDEGFYEGRYDSSESGHASSEEGE